jgi:O-antigen ligase
MRALFLRLRPADSQQWVFMGFLGLLLAGGIVAGLWHQPLLLLPALAVPALVLVFTRWQWLYYLLFCALPFATEIALPGGLSMDVPSEPLLLSLLVCVPLALLLGPGGLGQLTPREWRHPLLVLPFIMLAWSAFDTLFSVNVMHSVKYLLAKCWYLVPCLLGSLVVIRRPADFWRVAACYVVGAVAVMGWVIPRHASYGFTFLRVNRALLPFFYNHVIYATMLVLLLPLVWGLARQASTPTRRRLWWAGGAVLLFGLLTSYTRASWLALPAAGVYYFFLRRRLTALLLVGVAVANIGAAIYLVGGDRFMGYAPDYEKTIWHGGNFQAHLASTYKLEDVSGMERVYRWVAAARMVAERPLTGTGPSTFNPTYKRYTVSSFRTYVSANTEGSTAHNYFLLQLAEQGIPGCLLFCVLVAIMLLVAERRYHASAHRPDIQRLILAVNLSLVIILFHLFLNELIEVDRIGTIYLLYLAVLIRSKAWLQEPATP